MVDRADLETFPRLPANRHGLASKPFSEIIGKDERCLIKLFGLQQASNGLEHLRKAGRIARVLPRLAISFKNRRQPCKGGKQPRLSVAGFQSIREHSDKAHLARLLKPEAADSERHAGGLSRTHRNAVLSHLLPKRGRDFTQHIRQPSGLVLRLGVQHLPALIGAGRPPAHKHGARKKERPSRLRELGPVLGWCAFPVGELLKPLPDRQDGRRDTIAAQNPSLSISVS